MSFVCLKYNRTYLNHYELILHRADYKINKKSGEAISIIATYVYQYDGIDCHFKRKIYRCAKCKKEFLYENCCRTHTKTHELKSECALCGKIFTSKQNLKKHLQIHTLETPYQCEICSKPFLRKDKLIAHGKTHRKDKLVVHGIALRGSTKENVEPTTQLLKTRSFQCKLCPKQYTRKQHLDLHQFSHSKESPYVCDFCGLQFLRKDHLKSHETIHKYNAVTNKCSCAVCGECFLKDLLKPHVLSDHSDIMKFKCDKCVKSFRNKGNLTYHKRCHIGDTN